MCSKIYIKFIVCLKVLQLNFIAVGKKFPKLFEDWTGKNNGFVNVSFNRR